LSRLPSSSAKACLVASETRVGNHGRVTSRSSRPLGLASRRLNSTVNDQRRSGFQCGRGAPTIVTRSEKPPATQCFAVVAYVQRTGWSLIQRLNRPKPRHPLHAYPQFPQDLVVGQDAGAAHATHPKRIPPTRKVGHQTGSRIPSTTNPATPGASILQTRSKPWSAGSSVE
jgi:hypothetical protein